MNIDLETQLRNELDRDAEQGRLVAPEWSDEPTVRILQPSPTRWVPNVVKVAAAAAIIVGGVAIFTSRQPDISPATSTPPTQSATTLLPTGDIAMLVPDELPTGYVLYANQGVTEQDRIEAQSDRIFGPPDAQPDQIVEVSGGTDIEGVPCGATTDAFTITDVPTFCPNGYSAKQLNWSIDGTSVVIWSGSTVEDKTLLELAASVSIKPGAQGGWLDDTELIVNSLPDPSWVRLGHNGPEPLISTSYTVGALENRAAPTFLVDVFTGTEATDIWSIMNNKPGSTPVEVRATTGFLNDSDDHNPFLVWQEAPGIIVRIQNSGGDDDSILAFAESLTPVDATARDSFFATAVTAPTPPPSPIEVPASTTSVPASGN